MSLTPHRPAASSSSCASPNSTPFPLGLVSAHNIGMFQHLAHLPLLNKAAQGVLVKGRVICEHLECDNLAVALSIAHTVDRTGRTLTQQIQQLKAVCQCRAFSNNG